HVADVLLPQRDCGEFNQALMELGGLICKPEGPRCDVCPVTTWCQAFRHGLQTRIPISNRGRGMESVTEAAVVIERRGSVLLRQCGSRERWAGLWDFPRVPFDPENPGQLAHDVNGLVGYSIQRTSELLTLIHGVTRFRITLHCFRARCAGGRRRARSATKAIAWVPLSRLGEYAQSVTTRKISRYLIAERSA
ncbi:MAG TPA: NUDIX domain-containing protein, partial [Pirellulaceae bacterium]